MPLAVKAINNGKSLLPAGVKKINGNFEKGDHVLVKDQNNVECARGLTSFSSTEIEKIKGSHSSKIKIEKSVKELLKKEENFGIKDFKTYENFSKKIYKIKENVIKNISRIKENNNIVAYGSPAKATTALNFFGISSEIDFIVEDNKLKHGKFLPGVNIPIVGKITFGSSDVPR